MMSKQSRNKIVYLLNAILAFSVCIGYYYMKDYRSMDAVRAHVDGEMIMFSEESGFYDETITVSLTKNMEIPNSASIYYTLDGDNPTVEKSRYTGSIHLEKKKDLVVYPLKAVIYYGGEYSEIYEKTYVLSDNVSNGYNINVVSITSDSNNLYDYETGILVPGKTYDDNYAMNSEALYIPGNYNRREEEWVRCGHMTMFDLDGDLVIDQNIGLGVSGGTSASFEIKSLKIYADEIYDKANDKLILDLKNKDHLYSGYSFVNEYNSIRLRSGSQDMIFGNIRSAVISRLVQLSGFDNCTSTNRCIVYLNSEFYGIYDIQQNYSSSYLANRYNLDDSDSIEKIKGSEAETFLKAGISEYFKTDLNNPDNRERLEKYVDMDNYLAYYAINVLCNNTDWPANNFEMWRYLGDNDSDNPYSDGRYRFLIYDTDVTFNTDSTWDFFEGSQEDIFALLMEERYHGIGSSFSKVMSASYYRDQFVTLISDLMNTTFSTDNILNIICEENSKIEGIRKIYFDKKDVIGAEFYVDQLKQAVLERPNEIRNDLFNYFGLDEKYDLNLSTSKGIAAVWNHMKLFENKSYSNQYYKEVELTLSPEVYPGYSFQYWLVNGEKVYDTTLKVTEEMLIDGEVNIKGVADHNPSPEVIVSEISAEGSSDWIRISNVGRDSENIKKYYISDNEKNLMKYQLPDIVLEPGASIVIYGSKNHSAIGDYICNFSLNEEECIFLSDERNCLYSHSIPKMSAIETYGRYENSNDWVFMAAEDSVH